MKNILTFFSSELLVIRYLVSACHVIKFWRNSGLLFIVIL